MHNKKDKIEPKINKRIKIMSLKIISLFLSE